MPPKKSRPQVAGPGVSGGAQVPAEELQAQGGDVAATRVAAQVAPVQGQVVENDLADLGGPTFFFGKKDEILFQ